MVTVATLIKALESYQAPNVFNPWAEQCACDAIPVASQGRKRRLSAHLGQKEIRAILVGEAAGYQGCRYSGITFTSERLLLQGAIAGMPRIDHRLTTRHLPFSEPSATIVWGLLQELEIAERVILWNAFPWHPMKEGQIHSNRTPTRQELQAGLPLLELLLQRFDGTPVIAVGRKAAESLQRLGIKIDQEVRHPAMGGATKFRQTLRQFFG
jgi:uracil-DNA glycosylase